MMLEYQLVRKITVANLSYIYRLETLDPTVSQHSIQQISVSAEFFLIIPLFYYKSVIQQSSGYKY